MAIALLRCNHQYTLDACHGTGEEARGVTRGRGSMDVCLFEVLDIAMPLKTKHFLQP